MKEAKHLLSLIFRFLNRKETPSDKQELLDWYDTYEIGYEPTEGHIEQTGHAVKEEVMHSIYAEQSQKSSIGFWRPFIAAASLLLVIGLGYFWYAQSNREILASPDLLATIQPTNPQAKITLDNGQVIDLEEMEANSSIKQGNTEIVKDSTGQISYRQLELRTANTGSSTMQTPATANYTLTLSDGTTVLLNADTRLKYPNNFGTGDRIVELDGEAYFKVNRTASKQRFLVKTKQQITEVLGTSFNIKARKGQSLEQTTLEEGSIRVRNGGSDQSKLLLPGQQAQVSATNMDIKTIDLDVSLAWTKGFFYLDGIHTEETLQEIAAWYDIDISYTKQANKKVYKGKIPKNLPLNKLIELLEYTELKTNPIVENDRVKLLIK